VFRPLLRIAKILIYLSNLYCQQLRAAKGFDVEKALERNARGLFRRFVVPIYLRLSFATQFATPT